MVQQQMAPGFVVQMQETCSECGGRGNIAKAACPHCQGKKVGGRQFSELERDNQERLG